MHARVRASKRIAALTLLSARPLLARWDTWPWAIVYAVVASHAAQGQGTTAGVYSLYSLPVLVVLHVFLLLAQHWSVLVHKVVGYTEVRLAPQGQQSGKRVEWKTRPFS